MSQARSVYSTTLSLARSGPMRRAELDAYAEAAWWNGRLEQAIELRGTARVGGNDGGGWERGRLGAAPGAVAPGLPSAAV